MKLLFIKFLLFWKTQIPLPVRIFLLRAISMLVFWKIIYHFRLIPRMWYNEPLTKWLGKHTASILQIFDREGHYYSELRQIKWSAPFGITDFTTCSIVFNGSRKLILIYDVCNGFEMFVLFTGFLFCFPASLKRRMLFFAIGNLIVYFSNVIRCVGLAIIYKQQGPGDLFDFSHHYLFIFITYSMIFFIWVLYSRNIPFNYGTKSSK